MSPSSSRRESRIILHLHPTYLSFKSIAQRVIWTGSLLFRDFRLRSHANTLHGWINGMQWSVSLAIFNLRVISCDSFHVHFKSHWTLNYYDRTVQIRDPSSNNIFFTMIKNWTYISPRRFQLIDIGHRQSVKNFQVKFSVFETLHSHHFIGSLIRDESIERYINFAAL